MCSSRVIVASLIVSGTKISDRLPSFEEPEEEPEDKSSQHIRLRNMFLVLQVIQ